MKGCLRVRLQTIRISEVESNNTFNTLDFPDSITEETLVFVSTRITTENLTDPQTLSVLQGLFVLS